MAMSRKDYVKVAAAISDRLNFAVFACESMVEADAYREGVSALARDLAKEFKADNSRFRYDTFYSACGLDEWGNLV